jgi:hypothetical protein
MEYNHFLCFIISHKYYRGYESYLTHYIDNINKFYKNTYILVIDNNSTYIEDIYIQLKKYNNVKLLINDSDSKFEVGAYTYGINYIINNNLVNLFDYYIFTQDTMVLKNKYNFKNLDNNNITACTIYSYHQDHIYPELRNYILQQLNLFNKLDKITFCWCCCFIIHNSKLLQLYNYLKNIKLLYRRDSEAAERYLARILYELNNNRNFDIDGNLLNLKYDQFSVNILDNNNDYYFIKRCQHKTERTIDK